MSTPIKILATFGLLLLFVIVRGLARDFALRAGDPAAAAVLASLLFLIYGGVAAYLGYKIWFGGRQPGIPKTIDVQGPGGEILRQPAPEIDQRGTATDKNHQNNNAVRYCTKCGAPHRPDDNYCGKCGARVQPPMEVTGTSATKLDKQLETTATKPEPLYTGQEGINNGKTEPIGRILLIIFVATVIIFSLVFVLPALFSR